MKLSQLKPGDFFLSDSGVKFKVLPFTQSELKRKVLNGRIKVLRIDTNKTYYLTEMIIRKIV